jgi:hypothetical protein
LVDVWPDLSSIERSSESTLPAPGTNTGIVRFVTFRLGAALAALGGAQVLTWTARLAQLIVNPGWVAKALSMTRFGRWRAAPRSAAVVRRPSA